MDLINKNFIISLLILIIVLCFYINYIYANNYKLKMSNQILLNKLENCNDCISNGIELTTDTKFGRGVRSTRNFKKGEIIEKCPIITTNDKNYLDIVRDYIFKKDDKNASIAFGLCSMYNHNDDYDCTWKFDNDYLIMYAVKDIPKGKEIFTSYGDNYWSDREKNNQMKKI